MMLFSLVLAMTAQCGPPPQVPSVLFPFDAEVPPTVHLWVAVEPQEQRALTLSIDDAQVELTSKAWPQLTRTVLEVAPRRPLPVGAHYRLSLGDQVLRDGTVRLREPRPPWKGVGFAFFGNQAHEDECVVSGLFFAAWMGRDSDRLYLVTRGRDCSGPWTPALKSTPPPLPSGEPDNHVAGPALILGDTVRGEEPVFRFDPRQRGKEFLCIRGVEEDGTFTKTAKLLLDHAEAPRNYVNCELRGNVTKVSFR